MFKQYDMDCHLYVLITLRDRTGRVGFVVIAVIKRTDICALGVPVLRPVQLSFLLNVLRNNNVFPPFSITCCLARFRYARKISRIITTQNYTNESVVTKSFFGSVFAIAMRKGRVFSVRGVLPRGIGRLPKKSFLINFPSNANISELDHFFLFFFFPRTYRVSYPRVLIFFVILNALHSRASQK